MNDEKITSGLRYMLNKENYRYCIIENLHIFRVSCEKYLRVIVDYKQNKNLILSSPKSIQY